jgi:hypothetical protein
MSAFEPEPEKAEMISRKDRYLSFVTANHWIRNEVLEVWFDRACILNKAMREGVDSLSRLFLTVFTSTVLED